MIEVKHTPGPWEAHSGDNDGRETIHIEYAGFQLCSVRGTDDMSCIDQEDEPKIAAEVVATARLICNAPDLLKCLRMLNTALREGLTIEKGDPIHNQIKAVIKKAIA